MPTIYPGPVRPSFLQLEDVFCFGGLYLDLLLRFRHNKQVSRAFREVGLLLIVFTWNESFELICNCTNIYLHHLNWLYSLLYTSFFFFQFSRYYRTPALQQAKPLYPVCMFHLSNKISIKIIIIINRFNLIRLLCINDQHPYLSSMINFRSRAPKLVLQTSQFKPTDLICTERSL